MGAAARGRSRTALKALAALCGIVALCIAFVPTSASPKGRVAKGQVTISGGNRSAHVRIYAVRNTLSVTGGDVKGCRQSTKPGCSLAGVSSVLVRMGPYPDKVEVLDPLPVPLTVHLGGGSDKFIGNGEPDRCYSEGSIRNRCIGGGGDDICITGQRNSDCVGGPGDDVCKHGAGSDGCWGDAGKDVCYMGPGKDGCHGGPGNDRLYGGPDPDQLYGGPGRDWCSGGPGRGKSHTCERGPGH
jgi:Ca2+-binding RTX toxin-like protein